MCELCSRPGVVRLKIRGPDEDCGWVICRSFQVEGAIDGCLQACVVKSVVLSVPPHSDVRLRSCERPKIVQKVVREGIRRGVIALVCECSSLVGSDDIPAKSGKDENSIE